MKRIAALDKRIVKRIAVGCWFLLTTFAPVCKAGIAEGIAAYDRGQYEIAVREIRPLALSGDSRAQYLYGVMIASNADPNEPSTRAAEWYVRSAEQGYAKAQYELARSAVADGQDITKDARILAWAEKAAAQGYLPAKRLLAGGYLGMDPLSAHGAARAVTLYTELAEKSDTNSMIDLGQLMGDQSPYRDALREAGIESGDRVAFAWFEKAAKQGDPSGQFWLARMYQEGRGVAQNNTQALTWFTRAAEQDDPSSQFVLYTLYVTGDGGTIQDRAKAYKYALKAAQQNLAKAMPAAGMAYALGMGVPKDQVKAYEWFSLAAERGERTAVQNLREIRGQISSKQRAAADARVKAWELRANSRLQRQLGELERRSVDG